MHSLHHQSKFLAAKYQDHPDDFIGPKQKPFGDEPIEITMADMHLEPSMLPPKPLPPEEPDFTIEPAALRQSNISGHIREARGKKVSFGVPFLDEAILGLLPNDLCVIGGKPGFGKSQLGTHIAAFNAADRKRVLFIALEAEPDEIEMRLRYQIISGMLAKDQVQGRAPLDFELNYRSWRFGEHEDFLSQYNEEASRIFTDKYLTLDTVYRKQGFSVKSLARLLETKAKEADLVIIDHLHYFDLAGGRNEHVEMSEVMKRIRDLNLHHNIPIILLAHLRKDCYGLAPELSDFHGSSEIGKIATVCIMLSKNPDAQNFEQGIYGSILSLPKTRTGAIPLAGLVDYSGPHNCYLQRYSLARVYRNGDKETLDVVPVARAPLWAKNLKRG